MLAKLTLVVVLFGAHGLRAEHRGSSSDDSIQRSQLGRLSEKAVGIPGSEAFSELKKIILGQLDPQQTSDTILDWVSKLSQEELTELLELTEKKIPLTTQDSYYREKFDFTYSALLARENSVDVIVLQAPQVFPQETAEARFEPPQVYQHPSGALQLGRVAFEKTSGQGTSYRIPISPGVSSGNNVLRISLHGRGNQSRYALLNPRSYEVPVGVYAQHRLENHSGDVLRVLKRHLPQSINPAEIISESCNSDSDGCTPATYARWLQIESAPGDGPLKLKKVVMTPRGFVSGGILDNRISRLFGDQGSFGRPYYHDEMIKIFGSEIAPPHEYRLLRGGAAENIHHWTDTGVYTDSRESSFPLIGLWGEAHEYGRHLGLTPELGGGNSWSYLDKITAINKNPDATYFQKVRSNLARPLGSAAAFIRETYGLTWDLYRLIHY